MCWSGFDVIGYIFLGSCITMAIILTATTLYYRRKLKKLTASQAKSGTSNTTNNDAKDHKKSKKKKVSCEDISFYFHRSLPKYLHFICFYNLRRFNLCI